MSSAITKPSVGSMRQTADLRQIGALMIITGMCAIFFTVVLMSNLISPDGGTESTGSAVAALIGGVCEFAIGVASVFIGYNQLVHDQGNKVRRQCACENVMHPASLCCVAHGMLGSIFANTTALPRV